MTTLLMLLVTIAGYLLLRQAVTRLVTRHGELHNIQRVRLAFVERTLQLVLGAMTLVIACLIIGVGYSDFTNFLTAAFAVVGVALFAQWSILSNLTASLVIFFSFPYRIGDRIQVVEKDEDLSGEILEIAAFHVIIRRDDGAIISYPNAMMLQKAVIKRPPTSPASPEQHTE